MQSSTLDFWTRYIDFLFGQKVWGLATKDEFSRPVATPTLKHVLVFDMALRTQVANELNNGLDIQSAFGKVCGWQKVPDPVSIVLKQVHFLNHVSMEIGTAACKSCTSPAYMDINAGTSSGSQGQKRRLGDDDSMQNGTTTSQKKREKAKAKAAADKAKIAQLQLDNGGVGDGTKLSKNQKKKQRQQQQQLALTNGGVGDSRSNQGPGGKGKAAGKGAKGPNKLNSNMPENMGGKPICYAYGTGGCSNQNCPREHKCQICFGDHPFTEFSKYKKPA